MMSIGYVVRDRVRATPRRDVDRWRDVLRETRPTGIEHRRLPDGMIVLGGERTVVELELSEKRPLPGAR